MTNKTFLIACLLLAASLATSLNIKAQSKKMPAGKLKLYEYHRGGGMNPLDVTVYQLRYDKDTKKPMLTISGKCPGEVITFEVGEEVFLKCRELIEKHKLYKSAGFYKSEYELLDAPSSSFTVFFEDPYYDISGSGDMPDFIWKGINEIHTYFISLAGDRKAEGHVDRVYGDDGIAGLIWTDGITTLTTPSESVNELKLATRRLTDATATNDDISRMGYSHFREGDTHYIVIHDYEHNINHLYRSYNGKPSVLRQMVQRDCAALLSGKYTDDKGHKFVITADGQQGEEGKQPQPLYIATGDESEIRNYFFDNHQYRKFEITADGVDFYDLQRPGEREASSKYHLTRVADGVELWPVVNERFLSQPMLDCLSTEQLIEMQNSIRNHDGEQHWLKFWHSDVQEVNIELLTSELKRRGK